jgi:hypothetical protein
MGFSRVASFAVPGAAPNYTTPVSNVTFLFNSTNSTWDDAQNSCQMNGGHLAAYTSQEEQGDVEQFYESTGWLLKVRAAAGCKLFRSPGRA